ncbi:hypothetical protein COU19_02890 [Candidatus Kaiserbacteria bacterium CG10_big_fil_rev_8_21_14_0_10_56_12]|uniref:Uncharacterized protein n=1 Tax=Candidatus Kaiserbacteria bacterium CG10_big_fil_rev_8_21_14_0_10_56_12 TaxID=1974611 RepID=A0A2H0UBB4_9BACT|nr:MAG: hypothetical protein COU19_02890 [Candidatus Kaiserbacteria bacterium CG10_big_fil_rev_8_21_14_0_10_56_12]
MNNEHSSLTEKVLAGIEHTTPRSREYFVLRNSGLWLLAALSIIVGALAIASVIFRLVNVGVALRPGLPAPGPLLVAIPFVWIALMLAFGVLAYREIRSTKRGYKYEFSTVMLMLLLATVALGIVFYTSGLGFALDRFAARHLPFTGDLEELQQSRWFQPSEGYLLGTIQEDPTSGGVKVADPTHTVWQVQFADTVVARQIESLDEGERVGLLGRALDAVQHTFLACDVRSLEFGGRGVMGARPMGARMHAAGERLIQQERINECAGITE